MLVNVITDSPGTGTGFFMVVLAGAGASSTQMISTGKRGGRTAATVLGVLLILLSIVGIVLVIALDVLAPGFAVVVAILTAAVIALVVTACMFLYKPDVNAILTT
jgi:heme/copper-type cytochrome/quinol oxidase subunit 4